jgi:3-hydroxyisobutyrate dehydrogenase
LRTRPAGKNCRSVTRASNPINPIGFIGLGLMGEPMALNLLRAETPLVVWNRSPAKSELLARAGARIAEDSQDVFQRCEVVILMLRNAEATDIVLRRQDGTFGARVDRHTIINMATPSPFYSKSLEADIRAHGGQYVEAPVSGSRKPAEAGQLVAMLAGAREAVAFVQPLLAPMCRKTVDCGPTPNALIMKFAVNLFMICMVTGLAEAMHFAQSYGADLVRLVTVLDASPMASDVSRVKAAKLATQDFAAQAVITNVLENTTLITEAARTARVASPLLDICHSLYAETDALGERDLDMVAVIRAIEQRTAALR